MSQIDTLKVRSFNMPSDRKGKFLFFDNPEISSFFYSLSLMLPVSEDLMILGCRDHIDQIQDPELKKRVRWFIGQEAHHSRAHHELNDWLRSIGVDVDLIIDKHKKRLQPIYDMDKHTRLGLVTGWEHSTTFVCRYLLKNCDQYRSVPSFCRDLILWHAYEEIEHKAVLFDLYKEVGFTEKQKRDTYLTGSKISMSTNLEYASLIMEMTGAKQTFGQKMSALNYFYGPRGLMLSCLPGFLSYFSKNFHPNNKDDSALIKNWEVKNPSICFDVKSESPA